MDFRPVFMWQRHYGIAAFSVFRATSSIFMILQSGIGFILELMSIFVVNAYSNPCNDYK